MARDRISSSWTNGANQLSNAISHLPFHFYRRGIGACRGTCSVSTLCRGPAHLGLSAVVIPLVAEALSVWTHRMGLARPHLRSESATQKINKIQNEIYEAEIKIKTTSLINKNILLKKLLVDICNLANAA